jgi:hypothetical protein
LWYSIKTFKIFFFNITKFVGIRLRFLKTYKMSHGIQKSTYFNRFFCELDFVGLLVKITKKMFIKQSLQNPWDCVRLSWNQFCRDRVPFLVFFLRLIVHVLMKYVWCRGDRKTMARSNPRKSRKEEGNERFGLGHGSTGLEFRFAQSWHGRVWVERVGPMGPEIRPH